MSQQSILVVEDEPQISRVLSAILRRGGYVVTEARGVPEARAALAVARTPFSLIVCDVLLPGESGVSLAQDASCRPLTKVLLISGLPVDLLEERGHFSAETLVDGQVFFRQKPFSNQELLSEVDRILTTEERLTNAAY